MYWEVLKCPRQSRTSSDLAHLINVEAEMNAKKAEVVNVVINVLINVEAEMNAKKAWTR